MFNPVPTRLEDVFNSPTQFAIPVYQREYKWGKEEALELIEDLESYKDTEGENLFLGNLILEKSKDQKTFVVDGQQRLTTLLLLLIACRMRARDLGLTKLEPRIQEKITFMESTTGESLGCRLIASESVREIVEHMADASWDGKFPTVLGKRLVKRKVNKIRPIYDEFLKEVSDFNKVELSRFLGAIYNSYVARIEVDSDVEALSIFERTNARGLDLEISDLLKNYLFIKKVESIEELWEQILENSGGTILRMLKYFYVSKEGYVQKPFLYKKLKGYGAEVGPEQLTSQLAEFSRFYRVAKFAEESLTKSYFDAEGFTELSADQYRYEKINRALEALKEFNVVQFCPPAFAALECLDRNGGKTRSGDAKKLIQLFETFEKYHFINNIICERVGNEVERLYADSCVLFAESVDFVKTTDKLINELKSKLAKEEEFVAKFAELSYSSDQLSLISYVFDRFNNQGLDPGQCIRIYNPDPKLRRRNHNIEHFLPQKPETHLKVKQSDIEQVDNIGNLLAIYFKDNASLGNVSPAEKIKRLKGDLSQKVQNLSYVTEFIRQYGGDAGSWGADKIKKRGEEMARMAYREVWKIK
jgi:hypothetical protein